MLGDVMCQLKFHIFALLDPLDGSLLIGLNDTLLW